MFTEIKRLSGQALTYGIGHMATRLVGFLLLPIFTHHLSPDQFGVQALYYMMIGVMMEVARLGQDIALLNYYVLEKDIERRKRIFSSIFWGMLLFSTLLVFVIWRWDGFWLKLFIEQQPPYPAWTIRTLHYCALIIWLDNISAFPLVIMRGENRAGLFQFAKLTGAIVQAGLTVLFLVFLKRGVQGIFEANAISATITLVICLPTIIRRLKPAFNRAIVTACLAFGLPNLPNSLFVQIVEVADRKILAALRSTAEVGIYSASYKLGLFLAVVAMGFRFAWQPFFLQISSRPDAQEVYGRVLTYFLAVTLWLYLLLTAFVEPLAMWKIPLIGKSLIEPQYWSGLKIFPIILLAHVFNGAYAVFMVGVYLKKKMHALPLITGAAAVINVGMNILLVPRFGMWASAWATVAAYSTMTILLYIYINRLYPVPWEWKRVMHLALVAGGTYLLGAVGRKLGTNIVGYGVSIVFPLFLIFTGLATPGELTRIGIGRNRDDG